MEILVELLLYPFVVLSAVGLILSLAAHVGALLGLNVPGQAMLLHVGIFIVWIPAVITSNFSLTKRYNRKDFWKVALRGAPKWMQYMTYGFLGYAVFNFAIFILAAPSDPSSINGTPPFVVRGFSGHWMAFYSAAFTMLYSAIQIKKKDLIRRCPNGHEVSIEAAFCEECGQLITDKTE
jgi:hypothetical protein